MIISELKKIISIQLGIPESKIHEHHEIVADLGADSLDLIELVMEIETKFKIAIEEHEYENARTVQQIVNLIQSKHESHRKT
jgi:acyl carrier protein